FRSNDGDNMKSLLNQGMFSIAEGLPTKICELSVSRAYSSSKRLIVRHKVIQQREHFCSPLDDLAFQVTFLDQFDLPVSLLSKFSHVAVYCVQLLARQTGLFCLIQQQLKQPRAREFVRLVF